MAGGVTDDLMLQSLANTPRFSLRKAWRPVLERPAQAFRSCRCYLPYIELHRVGRRVARSRDTQRPGADAEAPGAQIIDVAATATQRRVVAKIVVRVGVSDVPLSLFQDSEAPGNGQIAQLVRADCGDVVSAPGSIASKNTISVGHSRKECVSPLITYADDLVTSRAMARSPMGQRGGSRNQISDRTPSGVI